MKSIIRETIDGHFSKMIEAEKWKKKMENKGYCVSIPFNNPFAFSNLHPYECRAIKQVRNI
jgi:hypothetical protein